MALGDIKTFDIVYDGLILQVDAIDMGDGTTQFVVRCIEGFADINAIYWSDGDATAGEGTFDGFNAKKDSSLNMNGTGEAWDGGEKLSSTGLGKEGADKPTYLTAGETLNAFTANVSWDSLDTIGIRATSTSTAEGSIKGVADDPDVTTAPDISVDDAACVVEGNTTTFTINLSAAYDYDITIYYETQGGTATEGDDYTGKTGSVTIKAGETSATVEIETIDDDDDEADEEHFTLHLTKAEVNLDDDAEIELDLSAKITDADGEGCIEDNDGDEPPPPPSDDFPTWPQDISNVVLYFDQDAGDTTPGGGDGYYLVKIDSVPTLAGDDLDAWIDQAIASLIAMNSDADPTNNNFITADSDLLGAAIKGGTETTKFYTYGDHNTNGTDPDAIPTGAPDIETPPAVGQVPGSEIDKTYNYADLGIA